LLKRRKVGGGVTKCVAEQCNCSPQPTITGVAQIGMPVERITRKIREMGDERGMLVYGYKFRPVLAGPQ
jgi:hypothetical protein